MRVTRVGILACGLAALCGLALATPVAAHEEREIVPGVTVEIGFLAEPAFAGEQNGLFLEVVGTDDAPLEGLSDAIQAEVGYGDQTMELPLTPIFNEPGAYRSVFFPTVDGDYSFRISGEIDGATFDETFTSSPEGFDGVIAKEPFEFPKAAANARTLGSPLVAGLAALLLGGAGLTFGLRRIRRG
ncbi:MAG: hypothetical protein M3R06_10020 [Chloroflexota bacterium]|nr:hypothetical protein [Chloroflexota bacterium]